MPKRQGHSVVRKIRVLREQLTALDRSLRGFTPLLKAALASANINGAGSDRSRSRLSAKARASLVLQGRYMGYMPRRACPPTPARTGAGLRLTDRAQ